MQTANVCRLASPPLENPADSASIVVRQSREALCPEVLDARFLPLARAERAIAMSNIEIPKPHASIAGTVPRPTGATPIALTVAAKTVAGGATASVRVTRPTTTGTPTAAAIIIELIPNEVEITPKFACFTSDAPPYETQANPAKTTNSVISVEGAVVVRRLGFAAVMPVDLAIFDTVWVAFSR